MLSCLCLARLDVGEQCVTVDVSRQFPFAQSDGGVVRLRAGDRKCERLARGSKSERNDEKMAECEDHCMK
jgi:hypothetical protein